MSKQNEWLQEEQRIRQVNDVIKAKKTALDEKAGQTRKRIITLRKNFWDDVTINLDEPDDVIETEASMKQQAELLSDQERTHGQIYKQLEALRRLETTPYFGRIDFHEDMEKHPEEIYIGVGSLMDQNNDDFLIYDWRAPISSMYYDYTLGRASYETMDGSIEGDITLKRQYVIKNGKLKGLFNTGLTIGDHLLQEVLGKNASEKMKTIVSTIQKNQNQIIRHKGSKYLVVQGVAGSGKTSIALQRVAYLLYSNRKALAAGNMLLFSPNPLFNSYVATVLPELGEDNMRQSTFQEYATERLGDTFKLEGPLEQMEKMLATLSEHERSIRSQSIQYKASLACKEMIDSRILMLADTGIPFNHITHQDKIIISREAIGSYFYSLDSSISIPNRIDLTKDWLLTTLQTIASEEKNKDWVMAEAELLDKEDYMHAYHAIQQNQQDETDMFDDIDAEWEYLSEKIVEEHFKPIRTMVEQFKFINTIEIYQFLFSTNHQPPSLTEKTWQSICQLTQVAIENNYLLWEDVTLFLYGIDQIQGMKTFSHIRYLFIDEAQDYTPFQFEYIEKLFPNSRMTILGDINQSIYPHAYGAPSILEEGMLDNEKLERMSLMKSYRSTKPIVNFTKQLIPGSEQIEPFQRDGQKPTLTTVESRYELHTQIYDKIKSLQTAGLETIAIITKSLAEAEGIDSWLSEYINVQKMDHETYTYAKGVLIIPSYLAKGIEFDSVIIYNASEAVYRRESERKLFYTSCTRAMHTLHLFTIGKKSPFLDHVDKLTYETN